MSWKSSNLFVSPCSSSSWRWLPLARQCVELLLFPRKTYRTVPSATTRATAATSRTGTGTFVLPLKTLLSVALLVIASFDKDLSLFHDCQTRTLALNPTNNTTQDDRKCLPPDHGPPRRSKKRIEESIDGARNENDIEKHCSDLL
jgi:hypothetical protein